MAAMQNAWFFNADDVLRINNKLMLLRPVAVVAQHEAAGSAAAVPLPARAGATSVNQKTAPPGRSPSDAAIVGFNRATMRIVGISTEQINGFYAQARAMLAD
jgi:hypothetical protein